jgi:hypothetical protein
LRHRRRSRTVCSRKKRVYEIGRDDVEWTSCYWRRRGRRVSDGVKGEGRDGRNSGGLLGIEGGRRMGRG